MIENLLLAVYTFKNDPTPSCLGCDVEFLLAWYFGKNILRFKIAAYDVHIFKQETVI